MARIKIISFLIILFFISCTIETDTYNYTIRNESSVDIKIIGYVDAYNGGVPYVARYIINLEKEESLTKTFEDRLPPKGYTWHSFYGSYDGSNSADSIKVIYNSIKYKDFSYKNINDSRNPLSKINDVKTVGLFIFGVEDYENAEDCNGNCDQTLLPIE